MKIQSLSVVVPARSCINNCAFCVSRMHGDDYADQIEGNTPFFDLYVDEYLARLNYARDNGCNALMLTGNCEPQQNREFLKMFGFMLRMMDSPFRQVEMQTTGVFLDDKYLRFLRNWVNVNVISISLSSFNSAENAEIIKMPWKNTVDIEHLCSEIKRYGFVLRLSLNLTDAFADYTAEELLSKCKVLGADQVTLRHMYLGDPESEQTKWLVENTGKVGALETNLATFFADIDANNPQAVLRKLEYGSKVYSCSGMSVVYDGDCMSKDREGHDDDIKYLILRPDCKLYSQWDDPASLIF